MTTRMRLGSEVAAAAAAVLRSPSRRAARSVVRVVHARVRVVLRSYYTVLYYARDRSDAFLVSSRRVCGGGLYRVGSGSRRGSIPASSAGGTTRAHSGWVSSAAGPASPSMRRSFSARGRRLMAISRLVAEDLSGAVSAYRRRTGGSPRSDLAPPARLPQCCSMRRRTSTVMPLYSFPLLVSTMYTCHGFEAAAANAKAARTPAMAARARR